MPSRYDEVMKTKPYMSFNMGYLTDALVAKAEKELRETDEVKAKALQELRKLVEAEPNFSCPTDDAYLLQYLRPRKFNVKKALSLMLNQYDVKRSHGDMYEKYDPDALKRMLDMNAIQCLPYRDQDGCAILLIKMRNWNPEISSVSDGIVALTLTVMMCVEDPATQVCGINVLVDIRGAYLKQIQSLTPRYLHLLARALKNCIPARFKGIHVYNESTIFHYTFSALKLFMSEKIKNRVHLHGDSQKQLHKFFPKAVLPAEYGGDNPNDVSTWFIGEAVKFFERYSELTTYGYTGNDENVMPELYSALAS